MDYTVYECNGEVQNEDESRLPPIRISLFGTSSIQDIYERVREALNPKLYKAVKLGTVIVDKASKILTGNELLDDIDMPFEVEIGMWKKSSKASKGCQLLVLDDWNDKLDKFLQNGYKNVKNTTN